MSTSEPPEPPKLLAELSELNEKGLLRKGVGKTEHFSKEDEESAYRKNRLKIGWHLNGIQISLMWTACIFAIVLVGLLGWIIIAQVSSIIGSDLTRASTLSWLWTTVLTVGATLFVERHVIQRRRR